MHCAGVFKMNFLNRCTSTNTPHEWVQSCWNLWREEFQHPTLGPESKAEDEPQTQRHKPDRKTDWKRWTRGEEMMWWSEKLKPLSTNSHPHTHRYYLLFNLFRVQTKTHLYSSAAEAASKLSVCFFSLILPVLTEGSGRDRSAHELLVFQP